MTEEKYYRVELPLSIKGVIGLSTEVIAESREKAIELALKILEADVSRNFHPREGYYINDETNFMQVFSQACQDDLVIMDAKEVSVYDNEGKMIFEGDERPEGLPQVFGEEEGSS